MVDSLIGIPWTPDGDSHDGCSCWGLVRLYYRQEQGINLPDLRDGDQMACIWKPVISPQMGDVIVFRRGPADRHVGIALTHFDMLHVDEDKTSCIENYRGPLWSHRLLRIYRHRQLA